MKKILLLVLFLLSQSHFVLGAEAPACDPDTMKFLLKIGRTITLRKITMSTNTLLLTGTATFNPNGSDFCTGTLTQSAGGFLAAGTAATGVTWRTLISIEYAKPGGSARRQHAAIMVVDATGGGGLHVRQLPDGRMALTSFGENFYFEE